MDLNATTPFTKPKQKLPSWAAEDFLSGNDVEQENAKSSVEKVNLDRHVDNGSKISFHPVYKRTRLKQWCSPCLTSNQRAAAEV